MVLLWGVAIGCFGEDGTPVGAHDANLDSITGIVTQIDDHVPVDGGVWLDLKLESGRMDTAFLPSFFTSPPPPPEQYEIYQLILRLEIGDRVKVEGERTTHGIRIEKLTVLNQLQQPSQ